MPPLENNDGVLRPPSVFSSRASVAKGGDFDRPVFDTTPIEMSTVSPFFMACAITASTASSPGIGIFESLASRATCASARSSAWNDVMCGRGSGGVRAAAAAPLSLRLLLRAFGTVRK